MYIIKNNKIKVDWRNGCAKIRVRFGSIDVERGLNRGKSSRVRSVLGMILFL